MNGHVVSNGVMGEDELLAQLRRELEKDAGFTKGPNKRRTQLTTEEIFQPLSPTKWTVDGLQLCPGRPAIVAGYGFSGKTMFAQALALFAASGKRAFGCWDAMKSRVLYIDLDQGKKATLKRFHRLAYGLNITRESLGDRLVLECHPTDIRLTERGANLVLETLVTGFDLVIIDALKGLTSGADENESGIRDYIDQLTAVSEHTDAAFVLLHHSGKGEENGDDRKAMRGSSSIFDAAGASFKLAGVKGEPKVLSQIKASAESEGGIMDELHLVISDVADATSPLAGVNVELLSPDESYARSGESRPDPLEEIKDQIRRVIDSNTWVATKNAIAERVQARRTAVLQAIDELGNSGELIQPNGPRTPYRRIIRGNS